MPETVYSSGILDDIYGVLDRTTGLEGVVDRVRRLCEFAACALMRHDFATGISQPIAAVGYDEELRRRLGGANVGRNPLLADERLFRQSGALWLDCDLLRRHELGETGFWQRWVRAQRFASWGCAVLHRDGPQLLYLEFFGCDEDGPFGPASLDRVRLLVPHLRRVLILLPRLEGLDHDEPASPMFPPPSPATVALVRRINAPTIAPRDLVALPPLARLRVVYGFTRAEARLAELLARGLSLKIAADRLCVSLDTVKTHLHRIYGKTGTSRQAELVALLLTGPAHPRADDAAPDPADRGHHGDAREPTSEAATRHVRA